MQAVALAHLHEQQVQKHAQEQRQQPQQQQQQQQSKQHAPDSQQQDQSSDLTSSTSFPSAVHSPPTSSAQAGVDTSLHAAGEMGDNHDAGGKLSSLSMQQQEEGHGLESNARPASGKPTTCLSALHGRLAGYYQSCTSHIAAQAPFMSTTPRLEELTS